MDKTFKVKAFMDLLKDNFADYLAEPILNCIPFHYEDEVWEFDITISKIKKIDTADFQDVKVDEVKNAK